jgi:hypothetical protein
MSVAYLKDQFVRNEGAFGDPDNGLAFTGLEHDLSTSINPSVPTDIAWDVYIPYIASAEADACFAMVTVDGGQGHWGAHGLAPQGEYSLGTIGRQENFLLDGYGTHFAIGLGGADVGPLWAHLSGYIEVWKTSTGNPPRLQLWAGRINDMGSIVIRPGAWMAVENPPVT